MIRQAFAISVVLSTFSATSPAQAQSASDEGFLRGRQFAELSVRGAFGSPTEDWSFYTYFTPSSGSGPASQYAVRRSDPNTGVLWADTRTCEPLIGVIASMAAVPTPSISIPELYRATPPPPPVFDGILYHLRFSYAAWGDEAAGDLAFGGNTDSPLADWSRSISVSLHGCWAESPPTEP